VRVLIGAFSIAVACWGLVVVGTALEPQFGGPPPSVLGLTPLTLVLVGCIGLLAGIAWTVLLLVDPRRGNGLVPRVHSPLAGDVAIAICIAGSCWVGMGVVAIALGWPIQSVGVLGLAGLVLTWSASLVVAAWGPRPPV
jgi:hypothetical protein